MVKVALTEEWADRGRSVDGVYVLSASEKDVVIALKVWSATARFDALQCAGCRVANAPFHSHATPDLR